MEDLVCSSSASSKELYKKVLRVTIMMLLSEAATLATAESSNTFSKPKHASITSTQALTGKQSPTVVMTTSAVSIII